MPHADRAGQHAAERQTRHGAVRGVGDDAVVRFDVGQRLGQEHFLEILIPLVCQGQPAAVVAGAVDEVVVHHDDERLQAPLRDEVVGDRGREAGVRPLRLVLARAVLQVQDRVALVRPAVVLRRRVDEGAAPFPLDLREEPMLAHVPVRHIPHLVIGVLRGRNLDGAQPAVRIGELQPGIGNAGAVHDPADQLVAHLRRLGDDVPPAFGVLLRREFDEGEFELDILRARGRLETEPVFAVGVDFGEFRLALRAGRALPAVGSRRDEGPLGVRGGAEEARRGEGEEEMFHHRRVISFPKDNENDYFCTN